MNTKWFFVIVLVILTVVTAIVADQINFQNAAEKNCGVMFMVLQDDRVYQIGGYSILTEDGFTLGGLGYYIRDTTISWFDEYSQSYVDKRIRVAKTQEISVSTIWAGVDYRIDTFRVRRLLTEHLDLFKFDTYSCISIN